MSGGSKTVYMAPSPGPIERNSCRQQNLQQNLWAVWYHDSVTVSLPCWIYKQPRCVAYLQQNWIPQSIIHLRCARGRWRVNSSYRKFILVMLPVVFTFFFSPFLFCLLQFASFQTVRLELGIANLNRDSRTASVWCLTAAIDGAAPKARSRL